MKRIIKDSILILTIAFISCIVVPALWLGGIFSPPPSIEKVNKIYERDKEVLIAIVEYLSHADYTSIYIPDTNESGMMFVSGEGDIPITEDNIVDAIDLLQDKYGYSVIGRKGKTIYFQVWSVKNKGRGIAFTIDGTNPELDFLTKVEKLFSDNWYYYEEDFNEWKLQND